MKKYLIRLLLSGIHVLRYGFIPLEVGRYRERLLSIRNGQVAWAEVERWRQSLHAEFDSALAESELPQEPDYVQANQLLLRARRIAAHPGYLR